MHVNPEDLYVAASASAGSAFAIVTWIRPLLLGLGSTAFITVLGLAGALWAG